MKTELRACRICSASARLRFAAQRDYLFGVAGCWDIYECATCKTLQVMPMPDNKEIQGFYASYFTHGSPTNGNETLEPTAWQLVQEQLKKRMRSAWLAPRKRRSLLDHLLRAVFWLPMQKLGRSYAFMEACSSPKDLMDYGCGSGELVRRLTVAGYQVEGFDFDMEAVANAKARGLHVHHIQGPEELGARPRYDVIFLLNVVEHVADPLALLKALNQLLVPGGQLILETPNATSLLARLLKTRWRGLEVPRHLHVLSRQALASLLIEAGYKGLHAPERFVPSAGFFVHTSKIPRWTKAILSPLAPVIDLIELCVPPLREVSFFVFERVAEGDAISP